MQLALGHRSKLVEQLGGVGHVCVYQRERALVRHSTGGVLRAQPHLTISWHAALAKTVLWRRLIALPTSSMRVKHTVGLLSAHMCT